MRVDSFEHHDSEQDSFNYLNNMTIFNVTREEESDEDNEQTLNYFQHKISSLEESFVKMKKNSNDHTQLHFAQNHKEFLTDLIKSLFREINAITENCSKQMRKINNKTEKIIKLTSVQKEIYEKYTQMKMNYKSVIKQTEYKDKQIQDLENLIKACDLEIFSLQSRINEMTNFFHLNSNNKISSWAFSEDGNSLLKKIINDFENKKALLDEMNSQLNKEKEELLKIADNLRNNLTKKDNTITELRQELELKNTQINDLNEEFDQLKMDIDRCKIKLESERKSNQFHVDRLKYLTESIKRKEEEDLEEEMQDLQKFDSLASAFKFSRKDYKKRYKSSNNLQEFIRDMERDTTRDFSCRKKISFMQSNDNINQKNKISALHIIKDCSDKNSPWKKQKKITLNYLDPGGFVLSPTKEEPNEADCIAGISESNLANTICANQSPISRSRTQSKQFDEDKYEGNRSKVNISQEVPTVKEEENALGLIMSMNSDTNSEEKQNLSRCFKRKISRISVTSSIDFIENGLKNAKNIWCANNKPDLTYNMLQIQQVQNLSIYSGRKKSINGNNINSNNYNNIININFNNYKTDAKSETKDSKIEFTSINPNLFINSDEKYLRIFFEFLYETVKYKGLSLQFPYDNNNNISNLTDKDELFASLIKEKIQFYNFYDFIQNHFVKKTSGRCLNDLTITIPEEVEQHSTFMKSNNRGKFHNKFQDKYKIIMNKKIRYLKNKNSELKKKIIPYLCGSDTTNINNHIISPVIFTNLSIQKQELSFHINSTNETRASINSFSNLKIESFYVNTLNSSLQINLNSSDKHKENIEQLYSDGLKSLYTKYFKYSDNFMNDTMKTKSQVKNLNHLYPNSKWNKYISRKNLSNKENSNQLAKFIKPSIISNQRVIPIISPKNSQNPNFLNYMRTQYYYNIFLQRKNFSKE